MFFGMNVQVALSRRQRSRSLASTSSSAGTGGVWNPRPANCDALYEECADMCNEHEYEDGQMGCLIGCEAGQMLCEMITTIW